jgi:hypothetical protein
MVTMLKFFLPLVLAITGCAISPKISSMRFYAKESHNAIIYGGISGVPDGYSCVFHFDYRDLSGKSHRVSRAFQGDDRHTKGGDFQYTFSLPAGRWNLRQIDFMGMKQTGESTLMTRSPIEALVLFRMRDSLQSSFGFDAIRDSLYYLGRWRFDGFESLDTRLPEAMARFSASKRNPSDSSRHAIPFSLSVEDSAKADFDYFRKNQSNFRSKKSLSVIPNYPPGQETYAFDLLIANPETAHHNFANDYAMKQMMAPRIPKF